VQTLVITHSPQVAAKGSAHFRVSKAYDEAAKLTLTTLVKLGKEERVNEVARIISGDKVTKEAIAAAKQLF
jgi:DNA repair protein RecN (Recombination protein N)